MFLMLSLACQSNPEPLRSESCPPWSAIRTPPGLRIVGCTAVSLALVGVGDVGSLEEELTARWKAIGMERTVERRAEDPLLIQQRWEGEGEALWLAIAVLDGQIHVSVVREP